MQNQSTSERSRYALPVLFTSLVVLAYGFPLILGWFSFYGDDWIYIYNYHLNGAASFPEFVAWDRPYSAWIYMAATSLFGEHVLPYHLLLLAERWLAVFFFWKILQMVWPDARREISWAVQLFAVYPGFHQQPISVQYILHFASLALCMFSIWCMLKAAEAEKLQSTAKQGIIHTVIGVITSVVAMFSCEYFVGLEFIRPLLLWFFAVNILKKEAKVKQIFLRWIPYLIGMIFFLVWRVFIFSFQTYQPKLLDKLGSDSGATILEIVKKILADLVTVTVTAWRKAVNLPNGQQNQLILLLFVLITFGLVFFIIHRFTDNVTPKKKAVFQQASVQLLLTGAVALLAAGIPFWITMINIELPFPWDRPTISFSIGVALVISVAISLMFKPWFQSVVISLLVAVAVGSHFTNALVYRDEANKMNDYFWQLAWRVPQLDAGTILVSENIPLDRVSDNDLTPIVNWQYAPDLSGNVYQYKYFDLDLRREMFFASPQQDQAIVHDYRSHHFESDSNHVLALYYKKNGCLWTITQAESGYPGLPSNIADVSVLSNLSLIQTQAEKNAIPPKPIGEEPDHGYCYYFQKINLAFQNDDPESAYVLADEAFTRNYASGDPLDFIASIKAFAIAGDWERAEQLSRQVTDKPDYQSFFCSQMTGLKDQMDGAAYTHFMQTVGCAG